MKHLVDGPYFEDFTVGQEFSAPSITITDAHATFYSALFADRMRLPLDRHLAHRVTGDPRPLAHANLVINLVAGQTTYASQYVKGNLFYRGLLLKRPVFIGDSLYTTTKVVGLKQNKNKPGRDATGMVALEMVTHNQDGEEVMQFWRCPMIPCRDPQAETGSDDDFSWIKDSFTQDELFAALPRGWNLQHMAAKHVPLLTPDVKPGDEIEIGPRDTVTCAPELVRMTLNIAYTHTDASRSYLGKRLVYGGHTIAFALSQLTRALPNLLTVVAWRGCDHLGPVLEDDIISTRALVRDVIATPVGGRIYDLELEAFAGRFDAETKELKQEKVLLQKILVWGA
jgi:acyl dehydratase